MAEGKKGNYAFIDGSNLHRGIRSAGWKLSYSRFRRYLADKFDVSCAYLFLGFIEENAAMYRDLQHWGFTLVFKPTSRDSDNKLKGNCDAELVLQTMIDLHKENYSKAVIVTGDGDFTCLVRYLEEQQKLEWVLSPTAARCSRLLRKAAPDKLSFLEFLREKLEVRK